MCKINYEYYIRRKFMEYRIDYIIIHLVIFSLPLSKICA